MNDLLNDIKKLQKITDTISKNVSWNLHVVSVLHELRKLINEKQKQVSKFEEENMSYADYEEHMKNKGFDPQFLIDQEVARQDELRIDNNVA